jgi:hypothetical protein
MKHNGAKVTAHMLFSEMCIPGKRKVKSKHCGINTSTHMRSRSD